MVPQPPPSADPEREGDRRQEIVFIGQGMDEVQPRLEAALDAALLTEAEWELGPDVYEDWDDPFDFDSMYDDGGDGSGDEHEDGGGSGDGHHGHDHDHDHDGHDHAH